MNWQLTIVLAVIGIAGSYLSCRSWRAWRKASVGCTGGCGCARGATNGHESDQKIVLISRDSLKLRSQGR